MKLSIDKHFKLGSLVVFVLLVTAPIFILGYFQRSLQEVYTIWPPIVIALLTIAFVIYQARIILKKLNNVETDLRILISELQSSVEDYRHLINGMNEMIWVLDMNGCLIDVNESVLKTLGYDLKELKSFGFNGFTHNLTEEWLCDFLFHLPEQELKVMESVFTTKTGKEIPVELFINVVMFQGRQSGMIIARDITLRKELQQKQKEQELLQKQLYDSLLIAKEKAEESDRLKMAFLANMSHEIRTPMNGILGFMELLKDSDLEEKCRQEYIELVNASGQRLLNTINDIIEISKIESGEREAKLELVSVEHIMNFIYDFFKPEAQSLGLKFVLSEQVTGADANIITDKFKLDGILTNLVKNAIKFTKEGSVVFGNYLEDGMLSFFVKDTGRGIPNDRLKAIFDRFVQAEEHLARTYEGSGLGLAIAKAYVESLGGNMSVESQPYKGSTFKFSIPYNNAIDIIRKEKSENNFQIQNNCGLLNGHPCTFLIAEDDDISYRYLEMLLSSMNVHLIRANTGLEAVRIVRENPHIRMVLMDIKMPDLDGLEATRQIRKFNRYVPVIAQTAYALPGENEMTREAGCTDYISKPINKQKLRDLIEKFVQVNN